ncbi:hypothetical protein JJ685_13575 [Ramlibacter monticola]|uniref:Uncharacterized protein n=1 Tax=Ramlibacter monticola TaxID=1926872 RepID=A0A937CU00_9BURK|nr:hypothetical protein [Ramlibacter monticola]MBL0392163.1 hypothetical protein [Ramlibacter monticola]
MTRIDSFGWLNPLGNWEAAARWNAMAFEWMTRGWQQWLELATVWPGLESPAAAVNEVARSVDAIDVPASVILAPAGTPKARDARELGTQASRRRTNDEGEARPRAADARKPRRRAPAKKSRTRG